MKFYDFIAIRALDSPAPDNTNPGTFEVFQGLGAEMLTQITVDPETGLLPVAPATPIPDALWQGQNTLITGERDYCDQLSDLWKKQQRALPQESGIIWNFVSELLEGFLGVLTAGLVTAATESPALGKVAAFLAEALVGVAIEKLQDFFTKGIALCDGIKNDDQNMLALEPSRENYLLRQQAISQHTEQLENILNLINTMENVLDRTIQQGIDTKGIVKALKPVQDLKELKELPDIDESLDRLEALVGTMAGIKAAIEDLTFVDVALKYADNTSLHIGGKVLQR